MIFFLRVRERKVFIRESFAKSMYALRLVKGYHLLPRGVPEGEWYCVFAFPFIGSSQASEGEASEGEASPQPNTMVLKHILAPAAGAA